MHLRAALAGLIGLVVLAPAARAAGFSGERALAYAVRAAGYGPRPAGSAALAKLRSYIESEVRADGWRVSEDRFVAATPAGQVTMVNIIAKLAGNGKRAVAFTGHYDTKRLPGFVGANDGGSSTGFLLEMARALKREDRVGDVYLVWFDGEEAVRPQWAGDDNLYGSRHLAARWSADGTLARVRALINVDMIGDKDLDITAEMLSDVGLRTLVWRTAEELGYGRYFLATGGEVEDDHAPFLKAGVPALDLIDFDYGPANAYWHAATDTADKLGAHSFEVVGAVLVAAWRKLDG